MRFKIIYAAEYRYDGAVRDQHNAVRVRPYADGAQRVEGFDFITKPNARLHRFPDYFGTSVIQFSIAEPHDRLSIWAESRVATAEPELPVDSGWEALSSHAYDQLGAEYLLALTPAPGEERIAALAAEVRGETPLETLTNVFEMIPDRFEYRAGVTYVGSTVDDLLDAGAGVCQDFSHLAITLLRRNGIAARYVSGYLFAPNGDSERSAEVNTHAWLEALLPSEDRELCWIAADPTNRKLAGSDYVKIGHGRAYSDVPPIRGVYLGAAESEFEVRVTMTRLES